MLKFTVGCLKDGDLAVVGARQQAPFAGSFIRTNWVRSDNQDFLYATFIDTDGNYRAVDVNDTLIVTGDRSFFGLGE